MTFIHNECLVAICDETETKKILNKLNEEIEDKDYMPLTLFLNKKKFNINFSDYPEIDPRIIHFEKIPNKENEMQPLLNILLRFYSIYNELGDRLQIGTDGKILNYNLIDNSFPFNLNILCIGKFRQGKSTCVNCILNELKARENESGVNQT